MMGRFGNYVDLSIWCLVVWFVDEPGEGINYTEYTVSTVKEVNLSLTRGPADEENCVFILRELLIVQCL